MPPTVTPAAARTANPAAAPAARPLFTFAPRGAAAAADRRPAAAIPAYVPPARVPAARASVPAVPAVPAVPTVTTPDRQPVSAGTPDRTRSARWRAAGLAAAAGLGGIAALPAFAPAAPSAAAAAAARPAPGGRMFFPLAEIDPIAAVADDGARSVFSAVTLTRRAGYSAVPSRGPAAGRSRAGDRAGTRRLAAAWQAGRGPLTAPRPGDEVPPAPAENPGRSGFAPPSGDLPPLPTLGEMGGDVGGDDERDDLLPPPADPSFTLPEGPDAVTPDAGEPDETGPTTEPAPMPLLPGLDDAEPADPAREDAADPFAPIGPDVTDDPADAAEPSAADARGGAGRSVTPAPMPRAVGEEEAKVAATPSAPVAATPPGFLTPAGPGGPAAVYGTPACVGYDGDFADDGYGPAWGGYGTVITGDGCGPDCVPVSSTGCGPACGGGGGCGLLRGLFGRHRGAGCGPVDYGYAGGGATYGAGGGFGPF